MASILTVSALIPRIGRSQGRYVPNSVNQNVPAREAGFFFCKSRDFNIPFNVGTVGRVPNELELEVSGDGGNSWQSVQRSQPSIRNFRYQAASDGFYLFRLKLIDATGRASVSADPPLQVIIDTEKPTGELSVDLNPQGQLVASFFIVEPNLNPDSVRVEYRTEKGDQWQNVLCALQQGNEPFEVRGSGTWEVPMGTRQLMVRLTAQDQAENTIEIFRYPEIPRTANNGVSMQLASQRSTPRIPTSPSIQAGTVNGNNISSAPEMPIGTGLQQMSGNAPSNPNAPISKAIPLAAMPRISAEENRLGVGNSNSRTNVASGIEEAIALPSLGQPTQYSAAPRSQTNSRDGRFVLTEVRPEDIQSPAPALVQSLQKGKPGDEVPFQLPTRDDDPTVTTPQIEPYFSNSKTFSLDYDLEANPSIGIRAIELWGTADRGKSWENWGADPDRASPMDISVDEEGLFGFRIVIVSNSGLASNRPIAGDTADMWIQVDSNPPVAQITSAQYGTGTEVGSLIMEYEAKDDFLSERPITLGFGETPNGPWVTIATGLPNSGNYSWKVEPNLPKKVYLRLEVMDRAGNVGVHKPNSPIDIQGLTPRGRIQGIRPIRN